MPKPVQPGDKLTVSTKKSDTLALAWLNSQTNRSEAVMRLIREAAAQALVPKEKRVEPPARVFSHWGLDERSSTDRAPREETFSGLDQFLDALEVLGRPDV